MSQEKSFFRNITLCASVKVCCVSISITTIESSWHRNITPLPYNSKCLGQGVQVFCSGHLCQMIIENEGHVVNNMALMLAVKSLLGEVFKRGYKIS